MDVSIKLTVPGYVYRFYQDASRHVAQSSPEDIMADALCAYAGLLNKEIAKQSKTFDQPEEKYQKPLP